MKNEDVVRGDAEAPADAGAAGAMAMAAHVRRTRLLTAVDGALALMVILLVTQMWLLSATLDVFLAGREAAALPAAIMSALLFAGCAALLAFVHRLDRQR